MKAASIRPAQPEIRAALSRGDVAIKVLGIEFAMQGGKHAAGALQTAREQVAKGLSGSAPLVAQPETLDRLRDPEVATRLRGRSVLWVDDHPGNNVYEVAALSAVGVGVTTVLDDAAAQVLLPRFPRAAAGRNDGCGRLMKV